LAVGDHDNDGSVDLVITSMKDRMSLLGKVAATDSPHDYVALDSARRFASGSGRARWAQEVRSGSTFLSHSDLPQHFGLGASASVDHIEIDWPSFEKERIGKTEGGRIITLAEGRGITSSSPYKVVKR
jgi:hypothetical protein